MTIQALVDNIHHFGYFALFFALWLGIVGMPIPDEVIVMTGGMVGSLHMLQTVPAFLVTYLGVVSGLSLGYVLGRMLGPPVLDKLRKKKKLDAYIARSERLLARHGAYTLIFSYFLPVVRHVVPYLVGVNKMSFARYALYSYSTGFVWTIGYFLAGYYFGDRIDTIAAAVHRYGWFALAAALAALAAFAVVRSLRKRREA